MRVSKKLCILVVEKMIAHNLEEMRKSLCGMDRVVDIEELSQKYDKDILREFSQPTHEDVARFQDLLRNIRDPNCKTKVDELKRIYGCWEKNSYIYQMYMLSREEGNDDVDELVRKRLQIKKGKSHSGIISVTVFTSSHPEYTDETTGERVKQNFSCAWNCAYCPNEPGQPRSYLKGEPGVLRANREGFDCVKQMHARMEQLFMIGHPIDKLEVLVLGGTWESYPLPYREEFVRDIYYAANVFRGMQHRPRLSVPEEQEINQNSQKACRVIGLTLETRPDTITMESIRLFRHYGCTRIQLGIQHIDDAILMKIRRQCTISQVVNAIKLLKDCGYKLDGHWMPNLPGSTVNQDEDMLCRQLLGVKRKQYKTEKDGSHKVEWELERPDLQLDQWKVYPCTLVPYTQILEWYKEGKYVPYGQSELKDVLLKMKALVFPWIRLNRIIRDIPECYSVRTDYDASMRQDLEAILRRDGWYCSCIRCREVKGRTFDPDDCVLRIHRYNASDGEELFLSYETHNGRVLYGFLRLRLPSKTSNALQVFPELHGCVLVRELHVYGELQMVGKCGNVAVQHRGIGKALLQKAEQLSRERGYIKVSVIAGEGTRNYYAKCGYENHTGHGRFMMKNVASR